MMDMGYLFQCSRVRPRALAIVLAVASLSPGLAAEITDLPPTPTGPAVRSACEYDYPPFCIVDKAGRADGFAIELMRAALQAMGRDVTFRVGPWDEVKGWLERREVDALPLVGRTPEREAFFDFTVPYMTLHGAIVVRRDEMGVVALRDLAGRRVAVMKEDNTEEFLRREPRPFTIVTTPSFEEALRDLSEGRCDAVFIQRLVALRLIDQLGLDNVKVVGEPVGEFRQDFCFAVSEGDRDTLALLNEGLALVIADGTYRRLHAKWFASLELPEDRRIVVGGDHNYPPYEFLNEHGDPDGYNVEITRAIAQELGLDIEIRLGPWSEVIRQLRQGEIDVLQGMFYSPERDKSFDFSPPYAVTHYVSVTRKENGGLPSTIDQLKGKSIVVQEGDIMHDFAVEQGLTEHLALVDSQDLALEELAEGKHDCALVARMTALYLIQQHGYENLIVGNASFLSPEYCYAVPNGHGALIAQLSEGLKVVEATGEYRRIHEKWLGVYEDEPVTFLEALRYSGMVLAPLLVVLLASMVWSWALRKKVASRTEELRRSEAQFRSLVDGAPYAIFVQTERRFAYVNPAACELFGASSPEQLLGRSVLERFHPSAREGVTERIRRLNEGKEHVPNIEETCLRLDDTPVPAEVSAVPTVYQGQDGALVFLRDISERVAARERVEHLNRVLRAIRDVSQLIVREQDRDVLVRQACRLLVEHRSYATALIVLTDQEGRLQSWAQEGMAGDGLAKLVARLDQGELPPCCEVLGNEDGIGLVSDRRVCRRCPARPGCDDTATIAVRLAYGPIIFGYLAISLEHHFGLDEEERELLTEMAGDLAYALNTMAERAARVQAEQDREDMQRQLLQSQKMEAVGQLAGGVAHDFNNLLQVINGVTDMVLEDLGPGHPARESLLEVAKAGDRAATLVSQLLSFSRRQIMRPTTLDLNEVVENLFRMLRRVIGEHIRLEWLPGNHLGLVHADTGMLDQVLMNLCVNARDAMPQGGVLTIETQNVLIDSEYCALHAWAKPGRFVLLSVTDTGCGMEPETIEHIFDPFFTTKDPGKGTGLGLATVYGILRQHEGMITAYSEMAKGSTFKIYLPICERKAEVVGTLVEGGVAGGNETILLAEDDEMVRDLARRILERAGYAVLEAKDGHEAVALFKQHADVVDLLVLDVVMPHMGGHQAFERIRAQRPEVRALFCSGYSENAVHTDFVLHEGLRLIQKPYAPAALLRAVRSALDESA